MKRFLGLIVLVFIGAIGWRVGRGLSSDAVSMAVGIFFGILAGIPAALLVLASERRRPERATREYGRDYGQNNGREYGVSRHEGYYHPPQPPVIVLTGAAGTAAHQPYVELPSHGQGAGYPADWATTRPARQYKVVGEQEEWVQEW